ncbi:hypothetical protein ACGFI9_19960 [Micromonospora sp. NPDC048930]|uniref:hypothetical protein n=1 Tax=Micromonospora sp. NPDC048930 TaxID=3364261 RepID=UPI003710DEF6
MSYRDWGSGEGSPRERQPVAPWDDPDPLPADPYASGRYRTPSRRRAMERGQDEPVDTYLPRWALESGVRRADGAGRHAAPDDEVEPPYSGAGWRAGADGGWRREGDRRESRAIAVGPVSEHTAEWTVDAPQEQGYVGSRRAESTEDEPVSGPAPWSRPRRARTRRPQVTWSGLADDPSSGAEGDRRESGRRAGWSSSSDSWSRPGVNVWGGRRSAEPDPAEQPAVDPWDASGVHAWGRAGAADRWEGTGRWERTEHTGEWDRITDTGQWDRYADAGQWHGSAATGQGSRYAEVDQWDRTVPPSPAREGWASAEQAEAFWSGTRLAGDDPRWTETPTSAPRSPVVPYTAPRPRTAARRPSADPVGGGRGGASTLRRRIETVGGGSWGRRLEDDLLDPDPGGPIRPLIYTAVCYLVPALLVFVGLLFLDGRAPAGCVTDITGGGCDSPRAHAFASLIAGVPRFGLALVSSLVVAVVLRRVGTTWRPATVALAAAVVGGGLSTVMISAVTGQPIG